MNSKQRRYHEKQQKLIREGLRAREAAAKAAAQLKTLEDAHQAALTQGMTLEQEAVSLREIHNSQNRTIQELSNELEIALQSVTTHTELKRQLANSERERNRLKDVQKENEKLHRRLQKRRTRIENIAQVAFLCKEELDKAKIPVPSLYAQVDPQNRTKDDGEPEVAPVS